MISKSGSMGERASGITEKIETVEALIRSQEFQKASELILKLIDFFEEVGNFEKRDQYLSKLDNCYRSIALQFKQQQDYHEAAETYCSAAFLQKEHDNNDLALKLFIDAVECFVCGGEMALKNKNYKDASTFYCSAAKYAKNELKNQEKSTKYYQLAIEALQKEMENNTSSNNPSLLCRNHFDLGKIYEYLEDFQTAINYYNQVIELSTKLEFHSCTAECYQRLASCYERTDNTQAMTDCLNKAVHYRLLEAKKYTENNLPLEAIQNFILAANCVSRLKDSDELLMNILQKEASCFLRAAQWKAEQGQILQAAYYERNAAFCYDQLGNPETSINLFLAAAEKLLSIEEYDVAAYNFQDASLYEEQVGNFVKAAQLASEAAESAIQSKNLELAIQNLKRAAYLYRSSGYYKEETSCNLKLAECIMNLAESNITTKKFHPAAFLYYQAGTYYSKSANQELAIYCYEKAIENYQNAITIAMKDDEELLASYSACCATLVCLIMKQPTRAEIILKNIQNNSPNKYFLLSDSIIKAFKTKSPSDYNKIHEKFYNIIQKSTEIKNMLDLTSKYF